MELTAAPSETGEARPARPSGRSSRPSAPGPCRRPLILQEDSGPPTVPHRRRPASVQRPPLPGRVAHRRGKFWSLDLFQFQVAFADKRFAFILYARTCIAVFQRICVEAALLISENSFPLIT